MNKRASIRDVRQTKTIDVSFEGEMRMLSSGVLVMFSKETMMRMTGMIC